jgi:hypothetical protein
MTALLLAEPEPAVRGFPSASCATTASTSSPAMRAEQLPRAADPDVLVLGDARRLIAGVVPTVP